MLPGVSVPSTGLQTFNRHEKRCVLVEGNAKAICLGRLAISSADAIRKNMKGKAVRVFHYFNDYCMFFAIATIFCNFYFKCTIWVQELYQKDFHLI